MATVKVHRKYVLLSNTERSGVTKEMPFRVGGLHTRPLPIAIQLNNTNQAVWIFSHLQIPVEKNKQSNSVTIASVIRKLPLWPKICQYINRDVRFVVDVRMGTKSGVYCDPREAFQTLDSEKPRFQRAFIFTNFGDALISNILGGDNPPDYRWDFHPYEFPESAARIRAHVLDPEHNPDPNTIPDLDTNPGPDVSVPKSDVGKSDVGQSDLGRLEHEELIAVALALEARDPWVEKYLAAIEVPEDRYSSIELRFELSDSREHFITEMQSMHGKGSDAWDMLYSLFAGELVAKVSAK
ncbi:hypothetical protein VNI00_014891 [Paramarasmius palmivorus]|uniref:Uncharacterized protein n=1 Tax=Paramarasmius palmivorus TaxID=297713 RepID=A0AAW0BN62_9AGAR